MIVEGVLKALGLLIYRFFEAFIWVCYSQRLDKSTLFVNTKNINI